MVLSESAVRSYLRIADERGYIGSNGRDGRMVTPHGLEELRVALAPDQLRFIFEKLELPAFRTTFNPRERTGQLLINTSLFDKYDFPMALETIRYAFQAGLRELFCGQVIGDLVM